MPPAEEAILLRIFIAERDKHGGRPLYEILVLKAREMGLAGTTVLRAVAGFGHSHHLHSAKILRSSEALPLVVEIIDSQSKIDNFLREADQMMSSGLITLEKATVFRYGHETG